MERSFWSRAGGVVMMAAAGWAAPLHGQQTNAWNVNLAGSWTNTANWSNAGFYPDGVGDVAEFPNIIGSNRIITLADADGAITNGTLIIDDASHGYRFTITSGTTWVFDDTDGLAEIRVVQAYNTDDARRHFIFGPFTINDDLLLDHLQAGNNRAFRITNSVFEGVAGRSVIKTGPGLVSIEGNWNHSGNTVIDEGTLEINRSAGRLSATTNVITRLGGTLTLANNAGIAPGYNANRINDAAALTSLGGTFNFSHGDGAGTNYSETIGALNLGRGNLLVAASQAAANQTSTVTFASAARGPGATVRLEGPGMGDSERNEVVFTSAPTTAGGIIPYALIRNATNGTSADYNLATTNLASDGVSTRITSLTTYEQSVDSTLWGITVNARPTNDVTIGGNRSLGSLVLDDGIDLLGPTADRVLNFTNASAAAVIAQLGAGTNTINNNGAFEHILAFGNNEAVFQAVGTLVINNTNNAAGIRGTNGFVKAGPGRLILNVEGDTSPAGDANDMTGNFYINEGTLELQRADSAGATVLNLNGGNLDLINNANTAFNRDVVVNDDATITLARFSGDGGITHTLDDFTIADGSTLSVKRRTLTGTNPGYTLAADHIELLGDATISVQEGVGNGNGNFDTDKVIGTNAPNQSLTVSGIGGINDAYMVVSEDLLLTGDLVANGITLRAIDAGTNVQGNIDLQGAVLSVGNDFARELGTGDGQIQLTGGGNVGFSARGAPVSIRIEDGSGGLTNLVWGTPTFNVGVLYLNNNDEGNNQITLENSIDFNVAVAAARQVNVDENTAVISGSLTNGGGGVVDFIKDGAANLYLTGSAVEWNGQTAINGGVLRVSNLNVLAASLANSNLIIAAANELAALETTGTLTNGLGRGQGQVALVGGSNGTQNHRNGFSAHGGDFTIDIGGDGTGTGAQLVWNTTDFDPNGGSTNNGGLLLNSAQANGVLRLLNDMDLNGEANLVPAYRNIDVNGSTAVISGDITNSQAGTFAVGLQKRGAGALVLEGFNTYDGPTEVTAGTLRVNGVNTGGGAFNVAGGATLGGTGYIASAVTVQSNAFLAPGNSIGTLTVDDSFTFTTGGVLQIELDGAGLGSSDILAVSGALDIAGATVSFTNIGLALDDSAYIFAQYGSLVGTEFLDVFALPGGYIIDYNYLGANQIALVIPEPAPLFVLLLGALGLTLWARRGRMGSVKGEEK